jgi:hypothetical protein
MSYIDALLQADEHSARTERGIRQPRLRRLIYARSLPPDATGSYFDALDQADEHSDRTERGIRRSRLRRLAYAASLPQSPEVRRVVAELEARLGVQADEGED